MMEQIFEYTPENLRKLQLAELPMLKELDRICRKNDIKYVIDAGTLLGAVRHGGFIPWDDDIDVRMLRDEYEKFCEACKTELNKKFFLQTYKTDPGYRWAYSRILKADSRFDRIDHGQLKSRTGIFIDIFPCDSLPYDFFGYYECTWLSLLCRKAFYSEVGREAAKGVLNRVGFRILDLFPKRFFYSIIEHLIEKYRNVPTKMVRCYGWGDAHVEARGFEREWFIETKDIKFENLIVRAPKKTHEFLVASFGEDYMTPPPEAERTIRHAASYIDFGDLSEEDTK